MQKYNDKSSLVFLAMACAILIPGQVYRVDFLWNTLGDYLALELCIGLFGVIYLLIALFFRANPLVAMALVVFLGIQQGGIIMHVFSSLIKQEESITVKALHEVTSRRGSFLRGIAFDCCYQPFFIITDAVAKGLPPVEKGDICTLKVKKSYIQYMVISISCRKPKASEPQD